MPTPLRRLVFSFFFFFFIFVFLGGFVLCQPSSGGQTCPPSSCGHVEIKYPLWLKNSNPNPGDFICGFPDLGIDCENETAVLHAGNDTYIIDAVDYEKGIFNFLDRDLQKGSCPRARHNLTLISIDGFPLDPYDITFIRFYFNCSVEDPYFSSWRNYSLGCLGRNNGRQSFAILKEWELGFEFPLWFCEGFVESPVKKPETDYIDLGSKFPGLLKDGFNLRLSDDQTKKCGGCEKKNGTCTYVQTRRATGKYEFRCANPKQGWSLATKISIGLGAGIGGILISSLFFFFLYKRKEAKMRPNGSKLLSWTNSLEPSSRKDLENGTDSAGAPFFRYEELHDATDGFNPSNELGDGGFGTVYKGKLRDGRIVAVKRLYENNFKRVEQFMNEAAILNRLRHPNLVSLYGCTSRHSRELLLVYEFVPNGTVADHLHGHLATRLELNWPLRLRIALETATALSYLHAAEPQIIHRDIKTNNILLDANFHVKVADFGLSRLFPMDVTHVSTAPQGTPGYVDPEYHQCYQLTDKSDVYSFGVVLVELISSMPAVDITRHRNEINLSSMAVNRIQSGQLGDLVDPRLGFDSDPEVRGMVEVVAELAFRCLQSEKEMRPSMEEAVEVLLGVSDGGDKERETTEAVKMDEVVLLKAGVPPLSPESVMHKWSSRVTTPNASE